MRINKMKKKVDVVEDDGSIRDILVIILERAGYDVIHFQDGGGLLNGATEVPDIYLIDRQLSGIDGLDLCKYLKSQSISAHTPVIILSATPGIENLVKNAGAVAFVEKPFSKKNLVQIIDNVLTEE